jgi:hypothetical protein
MPGKAGLFRRASVAIRAVARRSWVTSKSWRVSGRRKPSTRLSRSWAMTRRHQRRGLLPPMLSLIAASASRRSQSRRLWPSLIQALSAIGSWLPSCGTGSSPMPGQINPKAAAQELLKRRSARRSLAEWARHKGFEPAAHHQFIISEIKTFLASDNEVLLLLAGSYG